MKTSGYASDREKWVLVTGSPRSGTSLLKNLFNTHPNIFLAHELIMRDPLEFIESLKSIFNLNYTSDIDNDGDDLISPPENFHSAEIDRPAETSKIDAFYRTRDDEQGPFIAEPAKASLSTAIWRAISGKGEVDAIGVKQPFWSATADDIKHFLNTKRPKVVFIARNPIEVVNSSLRRREKTLTGSDSWHVTSVEDACLEWRLAWTFFLELLDGDDHSIQSISYKDLCEHTDGTMRSAFEFLGLEHHATAYPVRELPAAFRTSSLSETEAAYATAYFQNFLDQDGSWDMQKSLTDRPAFSPPLAVNHKIDFSSALSNHYCESGFFAPEIWGRWMGREGRLAFALMAPPGIYLIEIKLNGSFPDDDSRSLGYYHVDDDEPVFFDAATSQILIVRLNNINRETQPKATTLSIHMFHAKTREQDPVDESRALACGFEWMCVRPAPASKEAARL